MLNTLFKNIIYITLSLLLSACTSSNFSDLFSNYNQQMQPVKAAQKRGDFQQAFSLIPERHESDGTYNLSLLEKGRLTYLANDYKQSQQSLSLAYQELQQAEQAAKVQISRGIDSVSAIVSNDNARRYDIPYYEQSMLHSYQALNYLSEQDLSGALVEIRRANLVQNKALQANKKDLADKQEELTKQGISVDSLSSSYPSMNNIIGKIKNGFQNAYTFYLSGVLYEAAGSPNDAYIDYKKALEIYPNNTTLQKDVWRLANSLAMTNDIQVYSQRFSNNITRVITPQVQAPENQTGQLVLIVENGIIASKEEVSINLPLWTRHNDARFYSLALPVYQNRLQQYQGLSLTYQGQQYQSEEIVRLQSLAAKQLQYLMPGIVARQIVRVIAKDEIRQQLSRKGGDIGNIFANLYNIASEKADTRSWSTLPDSIHILRIPISAGSHEIKLSVNGTTQQITVDINANRQTLIRLSSIGHVTNYQSINL